MDQKSPSLYPLFVLSPQEKASSVHSNHSVPSVNGLSQPVAIHASATSSPHVIPTTASASLPTFMTGFSIPVQSSVHNEQPLGLAFQPAQQLPITQQDISAPQPFYNGLVVQANPSYGALGGLSDMGTVLQPISLEVAQTHEGAKQMHFQQLQAQQLLLRQVGQLSLGSSTSLSQDKKQRKSGARRVPQGKTPLDPNPMDSGHQVPVNGIGGDPQVRSNDSRYHLRPSAEEHAERYGARVKSTSPFDSGGILPDYKDFTSGYARVQDEQYLTRSQSAGKGAPFLGQDTVMHSPQPRGRPHSLSREIEDYKRGDKENAPPGRSTSANLGRSASTSLLQSLITRDPSDGGLHAMAAETAQVSSGSSTDNNSAYEARSEPSDIKSPHPKMSLGSSTLSLNSKLNVEAEEFKSDPSRPLTSSSFLVTGMGFRAGISTDSLVGKRRQNPQPSRSVEVAGRMSTKLNVEAAAFKPRAQLPATEFSFSSTISSYKPIASKIPFIDLDGIKTVSEMIRDSTAKSGSPYSVQDRIFDLDGITVPDKKLKAIPIVRPDGSTLDNPRSQDNTEQEGESDRITQVQARHKKPRRTSKAGDEAPQFATPTHPPFEHDQSQVSEGNTFEPGHHPMAHKPIAEAVKQEPDIAIENTNASSIRRSVLRQKRRQASMSEDEGKTHLNSAPSRISDPLPAINGDMRNISIDISENSFPDLHHCADSRHAPRASLEETHSYVTKASISTTAEPLEPRLASANRGKQDNAMAANPSPEQTTRKLDEYSTLAHDQLFTGIDEVPASEIQISLPSTSINDIQISQRLTARNSRIADPSDLVDPFLDQLDFALRQHDQSDAESNVKSPARSGKSESEEPGPLSVPQVSDHSDRPPSYTGLPSDPAISRSHSLHSLQRQSQAISHKYRQSDSTSPDRNTSATAQKCLASGPIISHLKPAEALATSDRDSFVSSTEQQKLLSRSKFFDGHVDRLLNRVLDQRLGPLEKSLQATQDVVTRTSSNANSVLNNAPDSATNMANSDADDEDDGGELLQQQHIRSPRKNRRLDTIKAFVLEALEAHFLEIQASFSISDLSDIRQILLEMKAGSDRQPAGGKGDLSTLRSTLQDVLVESLPMFTEATRNVSNTDTERLQLRVAELEHMLEAADQRAKEDLRGRVAAENTIQQLQSSNTQGQGDLVQAQKYIELLESTANSLRQTTSEVSVMNAVLQRYLREAQLAEDRRSQRSREIDVDDNELRKAVNALRVQLEESIKIRDGLRGKFNRLQEEVAVASRRIEAEQASWREKEKDHILAREILNNRLDAETRSRERLELEIEALGAEQRESSKIHVKCEQLERANTNLESMANNLRLENLELQKLIAKCQTEVNELREAGHAEVKRATTLMERQVEAANSQVNIVRAELEMELAQTRMELGRYKQKYDGARVTGFVEVDVAAAPEQETSTTASETAEASLQEQHCKYEHHLEDLNFQHDLALNNVLDEKQRMEAHLLDRLSLSNLKTEHLQERINYLEEKLEITRAAASAAAQAAQHAKARSTAGELSATSPSQVNEITHPTKISPQALRESIFVLQDQLQERENRIEMLEQELAGVDREAPTKLKEQEAEIGWLRELLGVRMGDLEEIINALSAPEYDRDAIKDAAIRIKANVKMQQQERERATTGRPKFPSFTKISALATPRTVLPLAAAWGSWRKGKEKDHGGPNESASISADTPSKSWAPQQSLLSGLLTPPGTRTRRSPMKDAPEVPRAGSPSKVDEQGSITSRPPSPWKQRPQAPTLPSTPRLLSRHSYDHDAKSKDVNMDTEPALEDRNFSSGERVGGESSAGGLFGPVLQARCGKPSS